MSIYHLNYARISNPAAALGGLIPNQPASTIFTGLEFIGSTLYATAIPTGGGYSELRTLVPETGVSSPVGFTRADRPITGLAYGVGPFEDRKLSMFGITDDPCFIHYVNLDGETAIAPLTDIHFVGESLEFGPDGKLYAGDTLGNLYVIDKTEARLVGHVLFDSGQPIQEAVTGLALRRIVKNDAAIISHTIPPILAPSTTVGVGITVRNMGSTTWTLDAGYRLAVTENGCTLFNQPLEVPMFEGESVMPNGNYQFITTITAPATPGACTVKLQMGQHLIEYFGETLTFTVQVEERQNAAGNWEHYE